MGGEGDQREEWKCTVRSEMPSTRSHTHTHTQRPLHPPSHLPVLKFTYLPFWSYKYSLQCYDRGGESATVRLGCATVNMVRVGGAKSEPVKRDDNITQTSWPWTLLNTPYTLGPIVTVFNTHSCLLPSPEACPHPHAPTHPLTRSLRKEYPRKNREK